MTTSTNGTSATMAAEQVGAQVRDRAHEQPAGAPAARGEAVRARVALRDEVLGAGDEVGERVRLVLSSLPSSYQLAAELAAAAHVRDREHEAAVEQADSRDAENVGSLETSYEP